MNERFRHGDETPETGSRSASTTAATEVDSTREHRGPIDRLRDRDGDGVRDTHETHATHATDDRFHRDGALDRDTMRTARARQREEFGGINWGASFFGWLSAMGLAAILVAIISAAGASLAVGQNADNGDAGTIGIAGGIALLVALALAYFAGGYVAGRMSRFDGARQGLGVWVIALVITVVLAVAGAVLGAEYNVLSQLNLPRIPVDEGDLATGGLIALAIGLIATLVAAMLGGKAGERYHKKVDRAAITH